MGGRLLGGASDVIPLIERGELQQLLATTAAPPLPAELEALVRRAGAAAARAADAAAADAAGDPEQQQLRELAAGLRSAKGGSPGATFTLQAAAQWLQEARGLAPEAAASALARLQAAQLLAVADPGLPSETPLGLQLLQARPQLRLQLVADAPQPARWNESLNGQFTWFGPARPAAEVRACWGGAGAGGREGGQAPPHVRWPLDGSLHSALAGPHAALAPRPALNALCCCTPRVLG